MGDVDCRAFMASGICEDVPSKLELKLLANDVSVIIICNTVSSVIGF